MNNAQQRKQIHLTLSPSHRKKLLELKEKIGFTSISQTIEYLIMEESIASRIDSLIKVIEDNNIHKQSVPEGKVSDIPGVFKASQLTKYEEAA